MRNLSTTGLSMSQAQSISNLCNQRAQNISSIIEGINNAEKTIKIGTESYVLDPGIKMPDNIKDLLIEKGKLHGVQAFLMEALKSKERELNKISSEVYIYDISCPERQMAPGIELQETVDEEWGKNQLSDGEVSEWLEAEAYAAHIGSFIHDRGKLTKLRKEILNLPSIEWIEVEAGKKTPVKISKHHDAIQLNNTHEELAKLHRQYEQRVNYFKAKVKNLVSTENASRQKSNADLINESKTIQSTLDTQYQIAYTDWVNAKSVAYKNFEAMRELRIKETAALRIKVDSRFKDVIDMFLKETTED
jgi:hypothetical protein